MAQAVVVALPSVEEVVEGWPHTWVVVVEVEGNLHLVVGVVNYPLSLAEKVVVAQGKICLLCRNSAELVTKDSYPVMAHCLWVSTSGMMQTLNSLFSTDHRCCLLYDTCSDSYRRLSCQKLSRVSDSRTEAAYRCLPSSPEELPDGRAFPPSPR